MAKEIISLLVKGGAATAGPPLGPKLGPLGINTKKVVEEINKKTEQLKGIDVPVKVIVDTETKEYQIEIGTPPTSALLLKEANIEKGSGSAGNVTVGALKMQQIIKIALAKENALGGKSLKAKVKEVLGTCTSLGIEIEGKSPKEVIKEIDKGVYDNLINKKLTSLTKEEMSELQKRQQELKAMIAQKVEKK